MGAGPKTGPQRKVIWVLRDKNAYDIQEASKPLYNQQPPPPGSDTQQYIDNLLNARDLDQPIVIGSNPEGELTSPVEQPAVTHGSANKGFEIRQNPQTSKQGQGPPVSPQDVYNDINDLWKALTREFYEDGAIQRYIANDRLWDPMVRFPGESNATKEARWHLDAYLADLEKQGFEIKVPATWVGYVKLLPNVHTINIMWRGAPDPARDRKNYLLRKSKEQQLLAKNASLDQKNSHAYFQAMQELSPKEAPGFSGVQKILFTTMEHQEASDEEQLEEGPLMEIEDILDEEVRDQGNFMELPSSLKRGVINEDPPIGTRMSKYVSIQEGSQTGVREEIPPSPPPGPPALDPNNTAACKL
ncbi:hypothetical protein WMY93_017647 [Mugilogobius chulae]|uniref:Uncharacterized protein n=1 Tax=Mugilogobius chulae TaxID=88201 RepID=A0AAW0NNU5_9GOBI